MAPFKPAGEIAQWRIVYDIFAATDVDATVTYETLADALDLRGDGDRVRIQAAARQAAKHMLAQQDRAVETIPQVGYRVVPAIRHIPLAGQQVERAGRALDRGQALTTHVRLDELSESERQIVQGMALMFAQVGEWTRQINRRVSDHEDRLSGVENELRRLREERGGK